MPCSVIFYILPLSLCAGIYQPETFQRSEKYGLTVLTTTDDGLLDYLNNVMSQVQEWLLSGDVQKLVLVVAGIDSGETLERWQFNVSVDDHDIRAGSDENNPQNIPNSAPVKAMKKSLKEIHNEIQAIIRQITASVSSKFDQRKRSRLKLFYRTSSHAFIHSYR
jgi:mitotic spindle assembly checkpoint protein MAD2